MKILTFKNILFFSLLTLFTISCTTTEPVEEINDQLDGKWEAISFKTDDNVERITGDITRNSILFQKDSIHTGLMSIDIVTTLVTLEGWSGPYTLSNEGSRLTFGDKEFNVSIDSDDILNLDLIDADQPFDIRAQKVD